MHGRVSELHQYEQMRKMLPEKEIWDNSFIEFYANGIVGIRALRNQRLCQKENRKID